MNAAKTTLSAAPLAYTDTLELTSDHCPRLTVVGGLLPINGQVALGYLRLGYRPIPLREDRERGWVPVVPWKSYQCRTPTTDEVVGWWMRHPQAGIGLICGSDPSGKCSLEISRHIGLLFG